MKPFPLIYVQFQQQKMLTMIAIVDRDTQISLLFVSASPSLSLASLPLGELIHFDGVEWPCNCWTRRKRRRCKLVASDQIRRVCNGSLTLSLLPSFPPSSTVSQENNGCSQRESSGERPSVWQNRQTDTAATQRGRDSGKEVSCDTVFSTITTGTSDCATAACSTFLLTYIQ